jgi:hypothetical protein
MIVGALVGLVIGCLMGVFCVWSWRRLGPPTDLIIRITIYVGVPIGVIISIVLFAFLGLHNGW